jgi:hypothetical protein
MRTKVALVVALITAFLTALTVSPAATAAPPTGTLTVSPVAGTIAGGGTFDGTFEVVRFVNQRGNLAVSGLLSGTLRDANGAVIGTVTDVPVTELVDVAPEDGVSTQQIGECEILDLVLGPLELDLLGLVVTLDTVHLNITAERGPGNLLGNLLCGIAGALDGGGGGGLANLLNRLLGLLGL